nr:octopamine receptor Oamb-like [Drosophila suzukii]
MQLLRLATWRQDCPPPRFRQKACRQAERQVPGEAIPHGTKAAKTLAIIVGGFIVCWLPFFTMYLIRAFCENCIQPTVFSVLFWLGYCNSAINPMIYALFSNEFRIAFKRIVCRCVCTRSGFRASENFQMIAARALMAPATFHKTISGCSDEAMEWILAD